MQTVLLLAALLTAQVHIVSTRPVHMTLDEMIRITPEMPTLDEIETTRQMLAHSNAIRLAANKSPQPIDDKLCAMAQDHADFLARNRVSIWVPAHGLNGGVDGRARRHGFSGRVSENIAGDFSSPENAFALGWNESADHRKTVISDEYDLCGFGHKKDSQGLNYWVAVYGRETASNPYTVQAIGPRYPNIQITPSVQPQRNDPVRINELVRSLVSIQGKTPAENPNPQLLVKTEHGHRFVKEVALKDSGDVVIDLLTYAGADSVGAVDDRFNPSVPRRYVRAEQKPDDVPGHVWIAGKPGTRLEGFWVLHQAQPEPQAYGHHHEQAPAKAQVSAVCGPAGCGTSGNARAAARQTVRFGSRARGFRLLPRNRK